MPEQFYFFQRAAKQARYLADLMNTDWRGKQTRADALKKQASEASAKANNEKIRLLKQCKVDVVVPDACRSLPSELKAICHFKNWEKKVYENEKGKK